MLEAIEEASRRFVAVFPAETGRGERTLRIVPVRVRPGGSQTPMQHAASLAEPVGRIRSGGWAALSRSAQWPTFPRVSAACLRVTDPVPYSIAGRYA